MADTSLARLLFATIVALGSVTVVQHGPIEAATGSIDAQAGEAVPSPAVAQAATADSESEGTSRPWVVAAVVGLAIGLVYSVVIRPRIRSKARGSSRVP